MRPVGRLIVVCASYVAIAGACFCLFFLKTNQAAPGVKKRGWEKKTTKKKKRRKENLTDLDGAAHRTYRLILYVPIRFYRNTKVLTRPGYMSHRINLSYDKVYINPRITYIYAASKRPRQSLKDNKRKKKPKKKNMNKHHVGERRWEDEEIHLSVFWKKEIYFFSIPPPTPPLWVPSPMPKKKASRYKHSVEEV